MPFDTSLPFTRIPIVDIERWSAAASDAERCTIARAVYDVCVTTGFMYVVGHAVPATLVADVFAQSRAFFALPVERKLEIDFRHANRYRGYVPMQAENTDPRAAPDRKEAFDFGLQIEIAGSDSVAARLRVPNLWPADLPHFRATLESYFAAMRRLAQTLFDIISEALHVPRDFFLAKIDRPIAQMRVLHYPPQPASAADFGIGAHCDYECFTILAQDDVGGLQVKNQAGEWIAAPFVADAFVINIGEMLARWTNDVFKATEHRVINASGRERFSVPFFFATNYDTIIDPITVPGSAEPAHYAPIAAGTYLAARLDEIYGAPHAEPNETAAQRQRR